ncbi:MAG: hypothetical protein GF355_03195, partial [Candidatus Eisenbacteria bacterium]|nr:hypothetical protein [Candidatus Eisenbacteria bacterium]
TYYERLSLPSQNDSFSIIGATSGDKPIIDADGFGPVLALSQNGTVFENLEFTHGHANNQGGAGTTSRTISFRNCAFTNNLANHDGGAIAVRTNGLVTFTNCSFDRNRAGVRGGALYIESAAVEVHDCVFRENHAVGISGNDGGGAIYLWYASPSTFSSCLIENNGTDFEAGALRSYESSFHLISNTFVDNHAHVAAGVCVLHSTSYEVVFQQNIFANNRDPVKAIFFEGDDENYTIKCNDFWNHVPSTVISSDWIGVDGNFAKDPLFCAPESREYTLHADSPCAPGNHPNDYACGLIGAYDVGCGTAGIPRTVEALSWGGLKARYEVE